MKGSFPIEVAWIDEAGVGESHLIRPAPSWTEWSPASERVHGIPLATLIRDGTDHRTVARRLLEVLHPARATVASDQPAFDQHWLDMLMAEARCGPVPRLVSAGAVNALECQALDGAIPAALPPPERYRLLRRARERAGAIVEEAQERHAGEVRHRALPDAMRLWNVWQDVKAAIAAASGEEPAAP